MTKDESQQCFEAARLLLLNGASTSTIQNHCITTLGHDPSPSLIRKWRLKVDVQPRCASKLPCRKGHPVGQVKPFDPFTADEYAQIRNFNRLASYIKPTSRIAA